MKHNTASIKSNNRPIVAAPIPPVFNERRADPVVPTYRRPPPPAAAYQPNEQESIYQQPQQYHQYQPQPQYYQRRSEPFASHPAIQSFDINSGSYTINYGR